MGSGKMEKQGNKWIYEDDKTSIVINRKWCKGCRICVEFCPKKVLCLDGDKAAVVSIESCTKCMLCEMRCPDFAIEVFNRDLENGKKDATD